MKDCSIPQLRKLPKKLIEELIKENAKLAAISLDVIKKGGMRSNVTKRTKQSNPDR